MYGWKPLSCQQDLQVYIKNYFASLVLNILELWILHLHFDSLMHEVIFIPLLKHVPNKPEGGVEALFTGNKQFFLSIL